MPANGVDAVLLKKIFFAVIQRAGVIKQAKKLVSVCCTSTLRGFVDSAAESL